MAKYYIFICMLIAGQINLVSEVVKAESEAVKEIIFLGDSLTAGFGLDQKYSYPSLIAEMIREESGDQKMSQYKVVNAGISGDTTSGGLRRLRWVLQDELTTEKAILVLALGANDGLRGIDPVITKENLRQMITNAKEINFGLTIILVGMRAPPNMGESYAKRFDGIFPELATEFNLPFIPFLLEGVAANSNLNLPDGIHPNEKGYKQIADLIWPVLRPYLKKITGP